MGFFIEKADYEKTFYEGTGPTSTIKKFESYLMDYATKNPTFPNIELIKKEECLEGCRIQHTNNNFHQKGSSGGFSIRQNSESLDVTDTDFDRHGQLVGDYRLKPLGIKTKKMPKTASTEFFKKLLTKKKANSKPSNMSKKTDPEEELKKSTKTAGERHNKPPLNIPSNRKRSEEEGGSKLEIFLEKQWYLCKNDLKNEIAKREKMEKDEIAKREKMEKDHANDREKMEKDHMNELRNEIAKREKMELQIKKQMKELRNGILSLLSKEFDEKQSKEVMIEMLRNLEI